MTTLQQAAQQALEAISIASLRCVSEAETCKVMAANVALRKALADEQAQAAEPSAIFNAVINFAVQQGIDASVFLSAWREGDTREWPEFTPPAKAQQVAVPCPSLCELCIKRGYSACANAAVTTPLPNPPKPPVQQVAVPATSAAIKRFEPELYDEDRVRMELDLDGDWVKYSDFLAQQVTVPVPMSGYEISKWWASENGLEDCNMYVSGDFEKVVRAIEAQHGIGVKK